jgi:hypothetical protein
VVKAFTGARHEHTELCLVLGKGVTRAIAWEHRKTPMFRSREKIMTDESAQQKFDLYLSAESEFLIDGMVRSGRFGSATEAVLLAVELGVQKLAEDETAGFSSGDDE